MLLKRLHDIAFPVYRLRAHDDVYTNPLGILMVDTPYKSWALDDTNSDLPFPLRRLEMKRQGRDVYPLKDKFDTFARMTHLPSKTKFIDSEGRLFEYSKAGKYWNLDYHEITSMELVEDGVGTIVHAYKIHTPFVFYTVLNTQLKYIGLLSKHGMYIPYDLSTEKKESSRRMI